MDPVDDLVYSKRLRKPRGEVTLFKEDVDFIRLPDPNPNSSLESGKELLIVQGATYMRRDGMDKSIKKHDKDPAFAIKMYMDLFGLKYDSPYIDKIFTESSIIIKKIKIGFNRPRT